MADIDAVAEVVTGARCWGIELDPRYRVLAVTIEPDPLRTPGTAGEHQLLCFPVSVLLVAVTRPLVEDGASRTALVTFDLDRLTSVSERFGGAVISERPFGLPEPRPASWGPRYSLEGRTSASDGTRSTLTLDLRTEDDARLRLFARFDDVELRDAARTLVLGTSAQALDLTRMLGTQGDGVASRGTEGQHAAGTQQDPGSEPPPEPLRF
jgi:hypothetical protein